MNGNFEHNDLCVGIDLGTTNSVLATINEKPNGDAVSKVVDIVRAVDVYSSVSGEARLSRMKKPTIPSCVYYRQENNYEPLVGDFAKIQYPLRPHLVAKSIKSQMGNPEVKGLSPDIPDKSPAEISARILKHMLREASKTYRCEITDAVITVPANFDSAMCKATRDAAELAGIQVKNADGSERPILLSEPNAVIYDLINQIRNGEISSRILDLSEKKRVLVFDLGGGTLDITMHEIKRREDAEDVLKVDEIATNRYTLLGGDDFDEEIAKVMYKRYLKQYENRQEAVMKIRQEEHVIMPQLRVYAENLKFDLNEKCNDDYDSGWDDEDDEIEIPIGGNMGIGYAYDDTFTKEEIEDILSVFMARELTFSDYKKIDRITNTRNLIYPILDVLHKASQKLAVDNVSVDAVIVNGGMSKFYMVTDRLKEFFGFEPIVALDPDQAVARGAAVYHYYLHKYEEMQDDMKLVDAETALSSTEEDTAFQEGIVKKSTKAVPQMAIQWGNNILNDSLYLGMRNGAVSEIIPTGADLPYTSTDKIGFRIEAGQNSISVPIKSRNLDGTYRTISTGSIMFSGKYTKGAYVAFKIHMGSNKVITMRAWTSTDKEGKEKIEECDTKIAIDSSERSNIKGKFSAPSGAILQPEAEIHTMLQLCQNQQNGKKKESGKKKDKGSLSKRIASSVENICNAGNKEDFAEPVLKALETELNNEEVRQRLFFIARKIGVDWKESERRRLAGMCMDQINGDLYYYSSHGPRISTNQQAIYALEMCGSFEQLNKLTPLHEYDKYLQPCLHAHAKTRTQLNWILEKFEEDIEQVKNGFGSHIQNTARAVGIALRKDGQMVLSVEEERKIVKKLCNIIYSGKLNEEELICCILALGNICDQRQMETMFENELILDVLDVIHNVEDYCKVTAGIKCKSPKEVAAKMIQGEQLNEEEEQLLLTKLEV